MPLRTIRLRPGSSCSKPAQQKHDQVKKEVNQKSKKSFSATTEKNIPSFAHLQDDHAQDRPGRKQLASL